MIYNWSFCVTIGCIEKEQSVKSWKYWENQNQNFGFMLIVLNWN